jgi:hypothetical protein
METQMGKVGTALSQFSGVLERLISLEEHKNFLDRRVELAESALHSLQEKIETKFEKFEEKQEIRFEKIKEDLNKLTLKSVRVWAVLSAVATVGITVASQWLSHIFSMIH